MTPSRRDRSAAAPLALAWAALIVYASLFPFTEWHWPPGATLPGALLLPWPRWQDRFDMVANLLGYLPLGFLLHLTWLNRGAAALAAFAAAVLLPSLGSYALEVAQLMLPHRVPSLVDWALNSAGALLGAVLAAWLHALGWTWRLRALRRLWVERPGAGALTLLLLWPVGLLCFRRRCRWAWARCGSRCVPGLPRCWKTCPGQRWCPPG